MTLEAALNEIERLRLELANSDKQLEVYRSRDLARLYKTPTSRKEEK